MADGKTAKNATESCLTCRFWQSRPLGDTSGYGTCMRFPPESSHHQISTHHMIWCGEYKREGACSFSLSSCTSST